MSRAGFCWMWIQQQGLPLDPHCHVGSERLRFEFDAEIHDASFVAGGSRNDRASLGAPG